MLRGVIGEKLTLAAREILAVVEKTVANYEEEAAGFRQEINRQRRLLELLQPEVKLEALEDQQQFSLCEAGGGRLPEDQEQHKYEPMFQKYPLHELQCRRGLQEADFLHLLRSTFPQLAADEPFDIFITDNTKKLQPPKIHLWTPEEIERTIRARTADSRYIVFRPPAVFHYSGLNTFETKGKAVFYSNVSRENIRCKYKFFGHTNADLFILLARRSVTVNKTVK